MADSNNKGQGDEDTEKLKIRKEFKMALVKKAEEANIIEDSPLTSAVDDSTKTSPVFQELTEEDTNENVLQPNKNRIVFDRSGLKQTRMEDFTTIYVLGSASAGKTTLINRLLDKTEIPKPTIALDYTFARRTVQNPEISQFPIKEVCHIWELGGDAYKFSELIETPVINNHALDKMSIFLILDLSEPLKLWPTFDTAVNQLKRGITQALSNSLNDNKEDITKKLETNIVKRLGDDFPDKRYIEPLPLPVVIICTKFDLFQNFEPERRKQVSRILRLASHRLGASLNFFSKNEVAHNRRVRELFTHYAFGTRFPEDTCHDFNKGLLIRHGGDSYDQIWPGSNPSQFTFDHFKHLYESQVGKNENKEIHEDTSDDPNFREPSIDSQKNILKEELRMLEESIREFGKRGLVITSNR